MSICDQICSDATNGREHPFIAGTGCLCEQVLLKPRHFCGLAWLVYDGRYLALGALAPYMVIMGLAMTTDDCPSPYLTILLARAAAGCTLRAGLVDDL